jgi:hypothetical protein
MVKHVSKLSMVAAVGVLAAATSNAFATPIELQVSDAGGSTTGIIVGSSGSVSYQNTNFDGWNISFNGILPGVIGTSNSPSLMPQALDLSSFDAECVLASCSALTIQLTDTDFAGPIGPGGLATTLSGAITGSGTVSQWAYMDSSNTPFGKGSEIGSVLMGAAPAVAATSYGGTGSEGAFSLTLIDTLGACSSANCATYSLDNNITAAPEPGTLALFGGGLLGCALAISRRRRSSQTRA